MSRLLMHRHRGPVFLVFLLLSGVGCASHTRSVVLFDGSSTAQWQAQNGTPCSWPIVDGAMVATGGDTMTREKFRDFKIHLEYWLPKSPDTPDRGQRSNSGVYLQGRYEIQILDSYGLSPTYQDAGAIYHQKPPDVQASLPSEQWQTMEITFRAARFDDKGNKVANARVTVVHNGQVVQNGQEILGPTKSGGQPESAEPAAIRLQHHTGPVRFRNIRLVEAR